jgi:hypothetical protein
VFAGSTEHFWYKRRRRKDKRKQQGKKRKLERSSLFVPFWLIMKNEFLYLILFCVFLIQIVISHGTSDGSNAGTWVAGTATTVGTLCCCWWSAGISDGWDSAARSNALSLCNLKLKQIKSKQQNC